MILFSLKNSLVAYECCNPWKICIFRSAAMLNKAFNREDATIGYKLSTSNIGASGKKVALPLYMAMYL